MKLQCGHIVCSDDFLSLLSSTSVANACPVCRPPIAVGGPSSSFANAALPGQLPLAHPMPLPISAGVLAALAELLAVRRPKR